MSEKKVFPGIVEFYFGSPEESYLVQIVVNNEEEIDRLLKDVKDAIKELFATEYEKYKEFSEPKYFFDNSISVDWFIYGLRNKLIEKGWKEPNIVKRFEACLWGRIDINTGKYKTFYGSPAKSELEKIIEEATTEIVKNFSKEK